MRGTMLNDWQWVAKIEYKNYPDSSIHISSLDAPDLLTAVARIHRHCQEHWPYEIISIQQVKYNNQINRTQITAPVI